MSAVHTPLLAALNRSSALVGLFDPDDRLCWANAAFRQALGLGPDEWPDWESMMRSCHRLRRGLLIETEDIDGWLARVRQTFRRLPVRQFDSDLVDGRWISVTETLLDAGWLLVLATDITALKANESTLHHAHQQALQQSRTDALTGLHNRRHLFERLDELLADARRMRFSLAAAMLDLDHFKQINDQQGHSVGDQILVHFAQLLRPQLRPLDLVGRVGGDEFLIVFPNATLDGAQQALLRLHRAVAGSVPVPAQPALRYSFSSGLALADADDAADALFHRADVALYQAKRAGRGLSAMLDQPAVDPAAQPLAPG